MSRLSRALLASAVASGALAAGCNIKGTVTRLEPASFNVHIVCAGTGPSDCVPMAPGAGSGSDGGAAADAGAATGGAPGVCPVYANAPNLGTPLVPVDRSQTYYVLQVSAVSSAGVTPYTPYNKTANVYIQFEGSVTPARATGTPPLTTVLLTNGQGCLTLTMPPAFNQTAIWVEDPSVYSYASPDAGKRIVTGSFATGASEPIYRPSPWISDVAFTSDPVEETSALNNKHVIINGGVNGGALVVTSVTPAYFTVTDMGTASTGYQWGSVEVYTYSEPYGVQIGTTVSELNGQLSNYLGLPELNFPIWAVVNFAPNPVTLPPPHLLQYTDIPNTLSAMAPYKSGPVEVQSTAAVPWSICSLRPGSAELLSYQKYNEWVIAPPTADCTDWSESLQVVSNVSIPTFDPVANQGKIICSLQGILSVIVPTANVNLWTITPRTPMDLGPVVSSVTDCPQ